MSSSERAAQLGVATNNTAMRQAVETLLAAARSSAPILLRAELGSETPVLARLVHDASDRRALAFLAVSCPSLGELSPNRLAMAGGSTLFLDGVGDLPVALQAGVVHELERLAGTERPPRIVAATRHDLDERVADGRFRRDLFFRLNVVELRVPPLRERPEDIVPLANDLICALSVELGRNTPALSDEAAAILCRHPWPGNLRELRNVLERALLIWPGEVLEPEALTELGTTDVHARPRVGDNVSVRALEREHIERVMDRVPHLKTAAAILGLDASTLWRRRKGYGGQPGG